MDTKQAERLKQAEALCARADAEITRIYDPVQALKDAVASCRYNRETAWSGPMHPAYMSLDKEMAAVEAFITSMCCYE